MEKQFYYYVLYKNEQGLGSISRTTDREIKTIDDIQNLTRGIKKFTNSEQLIVLNYKKLEG